MTDSVMMQAFPSFPLPEKSQPLQNIENVQKEFWFMKRDLEIQFNIANTKTEVLQLKYDRILSDQKATDEVANDCFVFCAKNAATITKTATSIYEEIAVLAKYQREANAKINNQEERHSREMQMIMQKMEAMEARHAKEMQELKSLLYSETASDISDISSELAKEMTRATELNQVHPAELYSPVLPCMLEISDDSSQDCLSDLPIAQSLTAMLYDTNYPTL
jgi:hypothetical protein